MSSSNLADRKHGLLGRAPDWNWGGRARAPLCHGDPRGPGHIAGPLVPLRLAWAVPMCTRFGQRG